MTIQKKITQKILKSIKCEYLEVLNESHNHNVPKGSETHFKIIVISNDFLGRTLLSRHRFIHDILSKELQNDIHALALHTYTIEEWQHRTEQTIKSPLCIGNLKNSTD